VTVVAAKLLAEVLSDIERVVASQANAVSRWDNARCVAICHSFV